ncbi:response regulator transcription factor [Granulosicoccus antarcticus]|uniref:Transcriptional regulatory protein CreB n=1 Tax=Granulosicoccus antarcticus IMCC3135 TaxID=1192854 RepID=A0A2Z2NXL0_9GAMM|nr:response regulator transcription factor [Granulosicoccus antarcticus]ASJ72487.1 Transcriptional regulatory protein CreB [Granulosicoccus antarcticus IMCC3135]
MTEQNPLRRIVLVEDEPALRDNYTLALSKAGYDVHGYADPVTALAAVRQRLPDVAIIDIGLGRDSEAGFDLCRRLRELSARLPILFLTARDSELDVISGLRLGADDYLTKDISLAQLVARVSTVLRRVEAFSQSDGDEPVRIVGSLELNQPRLVAKWLGQVVELTVTEYWLVDCLARNPGQVRSRQQLMDAANLVLDDQTITAHVKRIRAKFVSLDDSFSGIQTVYGLGYRWMDSQLY